jgi:hypothetical protein
MSQFQGYPGGPPPNMIPPYAGAYGQPPARTSGSSIASLVLGILGCIPLITGLLAIVLGLVGISATRKPGVSGRGMAIAGLILGIISVLGWSGFFGLLGVAFVQTRPDRTVVNAFVQDLGSNNIPAAQALCAPGTSALALQQGAAQLQASGTLQSFIATRFNLSYVNGTGTGVIGGVAIFPGGGTKKVTVTLSHSMGAKPVVQSWQIQ